MAPALADEAARTGRTAAATAHGSLESHPRHISAAASGQRLCGDVTCIARVTYAGHVFAVVSEGVLWFSLRYLVRTEPRANGVQTGI